MSITEEPLIPVQREWNGWRLAEVRFNDLKDVHWFQPAGAPRPLLHGYVVPSALVSGDLMEQGVATPAERLLVCVIKCHMAAPVYTALAARAGAARHSCVS